MKKLCVLFLTASLCAFPLARASANAIMAGAVGGAAGAAARSGRSDRAAVINGEIMKDELNSAIRWQKQVDRHVAEQKEFMAEIVPLLEKRDAPCLGYVREAMSLLDEPAGFLEIGIPPRYGERACRLAARIPLVLKAMLEMDGRNPNLRKRLNVSLREIGRELKAVLGLPKKGKGK